MTIPTHIDMGPHRYTVDSSEETGLLLHDEEANGDSRPDRLLIRLDPTRPPTSVAETLLHELIHCAAAHSGLKAIEDFRDMEEQVVSALAPPLLEALRRNPDLVKYLTKA